MTAIEQAPLETIDDAPAPAWEAYRLQRGETQGDHVMPRGVYAATLIEVNLVRRRETGAWLLRLIVRTNRLGKYAVAWRGLADGGSDPYDLTETQVRALRRFAQQMRIQVPAPAQEIVLRLQALVGVEDVEAKIVHTPVGTQATLSRLKTTGEPNPSGVSASTFRVAGQVIEVDGRLVDEDGTVLEGRAAEAHRAHSRVLEGQQLARRGLAVAAQGCQALRESDGWLALGFESLNEYLAQPEVEFSRSEFYRLASIWDAYVLGGGVEPDVLYGASPSKLELPIPAIEQGVVSAEQAVADAGAMTRRDLQRHYRELLGDKDGGEVGDPPVRDSEPDPESRPTSGTPVAMDEFGEPIASDMVRGDGSCVDADELLRWAESYGHPETWAKKAQDQHRQLEELRAAESAASAEVERLADHVAELRTQVEAAGDRERHLQVELERAEMLVLPEDLEVVLSAARMVTATLRRVLVEIGDPKQKRMGKDLRAAVVAALDGARELGLEVA